MTRSKDLTESSAQCQLDKPVIDPKDASFVIPLKIACIVAVFVNAYIVYSKKASK